MMRLAAAAAAALLLPTLAPAEELPPADRRAVLHIISENDAYTASAPATDRYYTNGVRLGWSSAEDNLPEFMRGIAGALDTALGPARNRWGLTLGQDMFTPRDISARNPDPRDRPYAGHLYATLGLDRRTYTTLDRVEIQIGVVGPGSLGRQAQFAVHEALGGRKPRGWHYQLEDEATFNINMQRTWRFRAATLPGNLAVDALPSVGAMFGTVRASAIGGVRVRFGQGLERDFGPPRIRPAIGDAPAPVGEGFGWYVFGGVGGELVGRDLFLDGNTWRNSRRVDHEPAVGQAEAGAAIFWQNIRLSYTQVWRTREFTAQPKGFTFGSLSLAFAF